MSGQRGRDLLLKIADGAGGFVTLAGIRTSRIQLSAGTVDATSAESAEAWRELIAGAGVKTARVSGRGVFKDAASDAQMRAIFFAGEVAIWRLIMPGFGQFQGPFQITELTWSGDHDGEAEFSVSLESAGLLVFEAAP
jgi:TP901-1 family phage major tail protein